MKKLKDTGVFYYITCIGIQIYCWVMRQLPEKFWQDLIPDEKKYYTEKISGFFLQSKNNKQTWLIILFLSVVLIQKSLLEMHTNKNVWTYRSLFISAVYTSKLWITSFSKAVKKFLQEHQLSRFKTLPRPCLKWLNDKGYAPNWSRSCITTTPAAILSLKPWLVSSSTFGPRL